VPASVDVVLLSDSRPAGRSTPPSRRRWWRITVLTTVALLGGIAVAVPAHAAKPPPGVDRGRSALLAAELRRAVDERNFKDVLDTTPPAGAAPEHRRPPVEEDDPSGAELARMRQAAAEVAAKPIHQTPNLDVAVIDLDPAGRARSAADVLLSPRYPHGVPVPLDGNLSTDQVRWRWWDDAEWNHHHGQGTRDVLPGREQAPLDFTSPYPASVLKLMVGFAVLRLVDAGRVSLVRCLAGLVPMTSGRILYDGVDLDTLDHRQVRRRMGFVLQEDHLFDGTLAGQQHRVRRRGHRSAARALGGSGGQRRRRHRAPPAGVREAYRRDRHAALRRTGAAGGDRRPSTTDPRSSSSARRPPRWTRRPSAPSARGSRRS
jgi:ABC transporter